MEDAISNSVWVTSPEFASYLQKRGFHVSCMLKIITLPNQMMNPITYI